MAHADGGGQRTDEMSWMTLGSWRVRKKGREDSQSALLAIQNGAEQAGAIAMRSGTMT